MLKILLIFLLLFSLREFYECFINSPYRRYTYYKLAKKLAKQKNKKLMIVGDPYNNNAITKMFNKFLDNPLYGCGDICVDLTGCPKCSNSIKGDLVKISKTMQNNSVVILIVGTLEYIKGNTKEILKELDRISGGDIFIVTIKSYGGHYICNCRDKKCKINITSLFTPNTVRQFLKAPPEYNYFQWRDF